MGVPAALWGTDHDRCSCTGDGVAEGWRQGGREGGREDLGFLRPVSQYGEMRAGVQGKEEYFAVTVNYVCCVSSGALQSLVSQVVHGGSIFVADQTLSLWSK